MAMEWKPIRRQKGIPRDLRGPTHQQEHGRYYGQFVHTLVAKSTMQDQIIDQLRDQNERLEDKFQKFKDEMVAAMKALAQTNQPAVEDGTDGSTKD